MSFKTYTLGEIASNTSRKFDFSNRDEVCFINTGDILDGHFLTNARVSSEGLPGQAKKAIQRGDILYSEIRPGNKRHLLVEDDVSDYVVSTKFMVITCNREMVLPEYLYLVLTSKACESEFKVIADSRSGTFPQITFDAVAYYPIDLPSVEAQRTIVEIVKSVTNKLKLNTNTNQTLEEMAQAIFKSWFVDFDPVKAKMNGEQPEGMDEATASLFPEKLVESELGLIPEGWNIKSLEQIADFQNGFAFYTTGYSEEGYSVVDLGNISTEGKFIQTKHDKYVSEEIYNLPKHKKHQLNKDDLVMAMTDMTQAMGILGKTGKITESGKYILNQRIGRIRCKSNVDVNFILTNLNSKHQLHFLKARALGTVQKYVNTNHIKEMEFIIPCDHLMGKFGELVKPLFDQIYANDLQNTELERLRDLLLPKLLSGEIELDTAEQFADGN